MAVRFTPLYSQRACKSPICLVKLWEVLLMLWESSESMLVLGA